MTSIAGAMAAVAAMAACVAGSDKPPEHFRVLNGLDPADALRPGDAAKLLVK